MFGMTKRQFLKRSKRCLNETGTLILLYRDIMNKKNRGEISLQEASKQVDTFRKSIESIFSEFEKNEPPSKCTLLKQRIMHVLIVLHDALIATYDSLIAEKEGSEEKSKVKLEESHNQMEEFRRDFLDIVREVDTLLKQPFFKKKGPQNL